MRGTRTATGRLSRSWRRAPTKTVRRSERFAETVSGLTRTLRQDVLSRHGIAIKASSHIFGLLVAHAAFLYNRYQMRSNGLTQWEEIYGRSYREVVYHFGDA
eukprot:3645872-Heterocapsa_arctica.AAC.1